MVFKCQENSFLKEFESKVIVCEKTKIKVNGLNDTEKYEVILEDTILFPEGGGQPCDYGYLDDTRVESVIRRGSDAIHIVSSPILVGNVVKQIIDWDRRFDHMQQHSGQHLITAIIDRDYGFNTTSWWLGEEDSYIELDIPKVTPEQMQKIEDTVNSLIREHVGVTVHVIKENKRDSSVRTRGLPADHKGDIRVITIDGIESNMCCGTHVSNLSQLQIIKLLYVEKGKKNKTLLHFLVGNRVLKQLTTCLNREQKLTGLLKNNPSQHADLVDKLQKNFKIINKNLQIVLKDIAIDEVNKLKSTNPKPKYFALHRKEADADFMNVFIREYEATDVLLFLSVGDEKGMGNITLYGDENIVSKLCNEVSAILDGKGACKGNRYQAKVNKMCNRQKCIDLIQSYYDCI